MPLFNQIVPIFERMHAYADKFTYREPLMNIGTKPLEWNRLKGQSQDKVVEMMA
jgi:hypothetical protein